MVGPILTHPPGDNICVQFWKPRCVWGRCAWVLSGELSACLSPSVVSNYPALIPLRRYCHSAYPRARLPVGLLHRGVRRKAQEHVSHSRHGAFLDELSHPHVCLDGDIALRGCDKYHIDFFTHHYCAADSDEHSIFRCPGTYVWLHAVHDVTFVRESGETRQKPD